MSGKPVQERPTRAGRRPAAGARETGPRETGARETGPPKADPGRAASPDGAAAPPRGLVAGSERRTAAGPRAIGAMLDGLIGRAGQRRGFGEARVLTEWTAIVGAELAACTMPERIARARGGGAVLHLRVQSGWATTVQHMAPVVLERVNGFLGYGAVERLSLRQGPIAPPRRRGPPRLRPAPPADRARLEEQLKAVDDPDLAAALRALGEAVLARSATLSAPPRTDAPRRARAGLNAEDP